jgi:DNA-binding transcriptional regulator YhcF (GntR family)
LRDRIARELASGALEHGDRLPSVRELGESFNTDPRVVLGAYEQLVEEGLVEIRPRSGVFVTGGETTVGVASILHRRWILETMAGAIERDIPFSRLGEHIRIGTSMRRLRAAVIECNTDQLQSMRAELENYFGLEVETVELDGIVPESPARELRDADLLISGGHDREIASIAGRLSKPHIITRVRPSLITRLARLLARGPVYFLVVDPRFGAKMRRLLASMPDSENFHALVVGLDDLDVIPSGAPTYVMRGAMARVEGTRHRGRVISPLRIFAAPTAREILSCILELSTGAATS